MEVLGTVLGTAIQGQIVGGSPDCPTDLNGTASNNETNIDMTNSSLDETVSLRQCSSAPSYCACSVVFCRSFKIKTVQITPFIHPQKQAYLIASGVICIIYVLCAIVLFFGVKEQKGESLL